MNLFYICAAVAKDIEIFPIFSNVQRSDSILVEKNTLEVDGFVCLANWKTLVYLAPGRLQIVID